MTNQFTIHGKFFRKKSFNFPLIFQPFQASHRQTNDRHFSMFSGAKDLMAKKKEKQFQRFQGQRVIQAQAVAELWAASNKS